jgi:SAM-dependent methyltransferase
MVNVGRHKPNSEVVFDRYADWYDAFNAGKSYASEVDYVLRKVEQGAARPATWLDVGCGTGHHLARLQALGISVAGVDRSASMIARARAAHPGIPFHVAAAQDLGLDARFDVVSMLFHVLNYQVTDDAVQAALERVAAHLAPGGVFAFDFWNSDAVRRDPPSSRVRIARVGGRLLYRVSVPHEDRANRVISVHYEFRWDEPRGELAHEETHALRHFSAAELGALLRRVAMTLDVCEGWMTHAPLSDRNWYGFGCARRIAMRSSGSGHSSGT